MKAVTTSVLVKTPQQESGSVPRGQKKKHLFWSKLILFFFLNTYDIHVLKKKFSSFWIIVPTVPVLWSNGKLGVNVLWVTFRGTDIVISIVGWTKYCWFYLYTDAVSTPIYPSLSATWSRIPVTPAVRHPSVTSLLALTSTVALIQPQLLSLKGPQQPPAPPPLNLVSFFEILFIACLNQTKYSTNTISIWLGYFLWNKITN